MADELIGTVTATPTGPVETGVGQALSVTGVIALNGANLDADPGTSIYLMNWQQTSPGAPFSFSGDVVVTPGVPSSFPYTPAGIGTYIVRILGQDVYLTGGSGAIQNVYSNEITVTVRPFKEETPASTSWIEEQTPP